MLEAIDLSSEPDFVVGGLSVRPSMREIECAGKREQIQPRLMQALVVLARSPGTVVSRKALTEQCWGANFVTEDALNRVASQLRRQLRSIGSDHEIETIPRVGYRLIASQAAPKTAHRKPESKSVAALLPSGIGRWGALAGVALVAVLLTAVFALPSAFGRAGVSTETARYQSIAVLPFADLSQAKDLEFLAIGAAEEFRNALATADDGIRVSARASSSSLSTSALSPAEIASVLNVDALLEGSILALENQKRLSLSLVDPQSGHSLWGRSFDFSIENLDAIRPVVVMEVLSALNRQPTLATEPAGHPLVGPQDYERYLKANYYLSRGDTRSLALANELYLDVIDSAPDFSPAYAQLVATSLASPHLRNHAAARAHLDRAIELDPWGQDTLLAEQLYNDHMRADLLSEEWYSRPNEPRRAEALDYGARLRTLVVHERYSEAEALAAEILEHDPIGVETNAFVARVLNRRGKAQAALSRIDYALQYHPDSLELRFWRVNALAEKGDIAAGFEELLEMLEIAPDDLRTRYFLSLILGEVGFTTEAVALAFEPILRLRALRTAGEDAALAAVASAELAKGPASSERAHMNLLLHDIEKAQPWLQRMYERGIPSNYFEHASDYKPYLSLAYRQAGDEAAADALDGEILAEIDRQIRDGDESVVLFLPFRAIAAAARGDRPELYRLLDQAAAGGYTLFGLEDVAFDHLRGEPEFITRYEEFRRIRSQQHELLLRLGHIDRVREVISVTSDPLP